MPPTTDPAEAETVYTPEQVARLLGEPEWSVRELIRRGTLKAVRLGGSDANPRKLRVPESAYREYLSRLPAYLPPATPTR